MEREIISELQPMALRPLPAQPLVSVLVSNYNYLRFLGEAIQSALNQSYRNLEIIICDDGSTDDSVALIETYARRDARVRLLRKANGGQASGFNAAYAASQGDILTLLDSDDRFLPDKVEQIVADFKAHPEAGFGVHRVVRMNVDGRRQGVWPLSAPLPAGWYGTRLLEDGGILPFMPPTSGLSLHRDVAARIFPLPLESPLGSCPDQLITRLAPLLTRVTCLDDALSEYRLHGNNNYGPDRVTAVSFKREMEYCGALWGAQKRFLTDLDPALGAEFAPVDTHPYIFYNSYIYARLTRDPELRFHYRRFMAVLDRSGEPYTWFWKFSIFLPYPVFVFAINLLIRQSWLKQIIARVRRMS